MGNNWVNDPKNKNKVTTTGTNYALFGAYDPTKSVGVKASEIQPVTYAGNAIGSGGTIPTAVPNSYTPTSGTVSTSNHVKYSGNVGDIQVEEHVSTGVPVLYSQGVEKSWDELSDDEKVIRAKSKADGGDYSEMTMLLGELKQKELADASAAAQKAIADHTASYNLSKPTYGASGYNLATKGLAGSGYADYLANQNYATYRGNVQSALDTQAKTEAEIKSKYIDKLYNLSTEQKTVEAQKLADYINYDEGEVYLDRLANDWSSFGDDFKAKVLKEYKDVYAPSNMSEAFINKEGVRMNYNDAERELKELEAFANATGDPAISEAYVKMENAFNSIYKVYKGETETFSTDKFTDIDDNGDAIGFSFNGKRYNFYDITKVAEDSEAYSFIANQSQDKGIFFYDGKPYYKRGGDVYAVQYEGTKLQTNVDKVKGEALSTDKFTDIDDNGDAIGFSYKGKRYNFYDITKVAENSAAQSIIAIQPAEKGIFIYDGKPYYKRGGDVYEIEYEGTKLQTNVPEISNSKISTMLNKPSSNQK